MASSNENIGLLIRTYRAKAGLTQLELAQALGYANPQFVYLIECGKSKVPMYLLKKLIATLKIPKRKVIDVLVGEYRKKLEIEVVN
jgi:transcriptional regulator with XRE-family HTH domain